MFKANKFSVDLIASYLSLAVLGVAGIVINIVIGIQYGPEGVGLFNQVYAVFIVASQFAVIGIHYFTLKYVAEFSANRREQCKILRSALTLVLVTSILSALLLALLAYPIGLIFKSEHVVLGIFYAASALIFFAINKVLLASLNGERRMVEYSICQGFRYFLMVSYIVLCAHFHLKIGALFGSFILSEFILFIVLFFLNSRLLFFQKFYFDRIWLNKCFWFSVKGFLSGIILEVNTRVDILILSIFFDAKTVGVYSYASMIAEGYFYLLFTVQNNVNPLISKYISLSRMAELSALVKKIQAYTYPIMIFITFSILLLYKPLLHLFVSDPGFLSSWNYLLILLTGLTLCSGFLPFSAALLQGGYPGAQSRLNFSIFIVNVLLNFILVPIFGAYGSAFGMMMAYLFGTIRLGQMSKKHLNLRLLPI